MTKGIQTLAPRITIPTRLTTHSKTQIDIFDTKTDENSIAGNLTTPISDHLAQFLIYTNRSHRTTATSKQIHFKRNLKLLSHCAFKKELQINWHEILKTRYFSGNFSELNSHSSRQRYPTDKSDK